MGDEFPMGVNYVGVDQASQENSCEFYSGRSCVTHYRFILLLIAAPTSSDDLSSIAGSQPSR